MCNQLFKGHPGTLKPASVSVACSMSGQVFADNMAYLQAINESITALQAVQGSSASRESSVKRVADQISVTASAVAASMDFQPPAQKIPRTFSMGPVLPGIRGNLRGINVESANN